MIQIRHIILGFILFGVSLARCQSADINISDTTKSIYYTDYSEQLLLKFGTIVKSNKLELINKNDNQHAKFSPTGLSSLGGGFNYKWLGFAISFGLPNPEESVRKYGNTKKIDAQLNIFSKKFGVDAIFQNYKGFYLENPSALTTSPKDSFPHLPTMETVSVGVEGAYFWNHKKFSYKAAYVRNTVQNKSAGSLLIGGFYSLDYAGFTSYDSTSSFIPMELPKSVSDSFDIRAFTSSSYGISIGYTYTVVFLKKWFINLSLVPGFGAKSLKVHNNLGEIDTKSGMMSRFTVRFATGFESKHFLIGLTAYIRTADFIYENYSIKPSTSNASLFVAKRFSLRKSKTKHTSEHTQ